MSAAATPPGALTIGLDIGGTKTLAVAVDGSGAIVGQVRLSSGYGPSAVLESAVRAVEELRGSLPSAAVAHIGIGIPGTVDHLAGEVEQALNLGLEHLALGRLAAERLGIPVHVENDVNAAAVGASRLPGSPAGPVRSLAYLNLGTGLAAGLVLDGRLWRGAMGAAGEIGHVPLDPDGPECICGQRGCLEALASGSGIARQWAAVAEGEAPAAVELWRLAAAGDPRAAAIAERLVWGVASGVRLLVLAHDVDRIVLGGGLAEALGALLLDRVLGVLRGWERESAFLGSLAPSSRVALAPDDVPLAALGAALAAESERPALAAEVLGG